MVTYNVWEAPPVNYRKGREIHCWAHLWSAPVGTVATSTNTGATYTVDTNEQGKVIHLKWFGLEDDLHSATGHRGYFDGGPLIVTTAAPKEH